MLKKILASMFCILFALPVSAKVSQNLLVTAKISPVEPLSIQEMIDSAKQGSRIIVPAGVYNENIIIDKFVKLDGQGATLEGTVKITGDKAVFSNFILTNYGVENDGDPVVLVSGDNVRIVGNTFKKTEDAFEVVVEGDEADIERNAFDGIITTDSGFLKVTPEAGKTVIRENIFKGGPGGQWGPLQLFPSEKSNINVFGNDIVNADDKAVFLGGKGGDINFSKNTFEGVGVIFVADTPVSLNGQKDLLKGKELIESKNQDAEVVFGSPSL